MESTGIEFPKVKENLYLMMWSTVHDVNTKTTKSGKTKTTLQVKNWFIYVDKLTMKNKYKDRTREMVVTGTPPTQEQIDKFIQSREPNVEPMENQEIHYFKYVPVNSDDKSLWRKGYGPNAKKMWWQCD